MASNYEKKIIELVRQFGIMDGETPILHAPSGLFMRKSGRRWDLLFVGVYGTSGNNGEVPQFLMIEVDSFGNDTTNERFFYWDELTEELRNNIRSWFFNLEKEDEK